MSDKLNRFIEIKCNENIDWLKIIRENFLDMSFSDLTKTCSKSKEVVEELRNVYVALMLREYQESSNEMKHVIHWELEKQFGRVPGNNASLDNIEKEIADLKASRDYSDHRLKKSFPTSKTIVNKIMYMLSVNANPEEFIEKIKLDHECPLVIYNQFVRCCQGYSNVNLPDNMEHNTCYWLFRQTWISCDENQKITFELKRLKNNHDFLEGLNIWLKNQFPNLNIKVDQNLYNGYFIIPHLRLNIISFLDHIFLNQQFHYIVYKEHNITSKLWYTIVVSLDDETSITFNISQKSVNSNSKVTNHFGLEMCPLNSDYIKLNFNRIKDVVMVELVKAKLSKVFYYAQSHNVVEAYTKIDHDIIFQNDELTDSETDDMSGNTVNSNKMLKRLVPEIFLINYPRKCLHLPRLLKHHESKKGAMKFPINGEPSITRWYSCDHHEKAVFPGLRKNPLKNKASFPVIPCCYITDQELKIGSEFRKYYFNDVKSRKKNLKENITYSTNRIVPVDVTGLLTKQLSFLFWAVHCKTFRRYGVDQSPRSVLHCLSLASGKKEPTVEWLVQNQLYARQELVMCNGIHPNWVNPAIYLRLLEYWYKFNIVLFENSRDVSNFVLLNPQKKYYTAFTPYPQTVYILINHGLDADDINFPQCELLWYQNGEEVYHRQFIFNESDMLTLYDEYNGVKRVKALTNAFTQRVSLSGNCYYVNGIICDPPHPPYFQIPEEIVNCSKANVMFDYFEMLNTFQNQLLVSLQNLENEIEDNDINPDITTFSRSMSLNSRRHILKKRRFFEMNLNQSHQQIFYTIQDYLNYCKFSTYKLFSHPKIFNNMILQCEPFDPEQLITYVEKNHSFHLYSFSLNNEHYFKEYEFKGDSGKNVIIEYDNTWFRHVHDQST